MILGKDPLASRRLDPMSFRSSLVPLLMFCTFVVAACDDHDRVNGNTDADSPFVPFGDYRFATRFEYPLSAAFPGAIGDAFALLRSLKADPAAALVAAAGGVGVPAVDSLYGMVPDTLKGRLNGWINTSLRKKSANGTSLSETIDRIILIGNTVVTDFGVDTALTIASDGPTGATHLLVALRFFPPSPLDVVSIPRIDPPGIVTPMPAVLAVSLQANGTDRYALTMGPHRFTLAYGDYAWIAFNGALHQSTGSDFLALMIALVDCAAMAKEVAKECVGPICVGHETDLRDLCETGRAAIANDVKKRFVSAGFDALDFSSGIGTIQRSNKGISVDQGVWNATVSNGQDLRPVPATFVGSRQP
ncbi:MAG: hypothetical protein SGI86_13660 [Deltaproteobacteria bacterium]|nr:hypothetical protein [Deltaproteobacteria bacterium]